MKSLKYIVIVLLFISQNAYSQIGCRIGNYILINATGNNVPFTFVPTYSVAGQIAKRNYAQDPQCGIDRVVADAYPIVPGTFTNSGSNCAPSNDIKDWGKLVYYKQSDNTCNVNLPIDDDIWFLLPLAGLCGIYFIYKNMASANRMV